MLRWHGRTQTPAWVITANLWLSVLWLCAISDKHIYCYVSRDSRSQRLDGNHSLWRRLEQKELSDTQGVMNTVQEFAATWKMYWCSQSSTTKRKPSKRHQEEKISRFSCLQPALIACLLVSAFHVSFTECLPTCFPMPSLPEHAHSACTSFSLLTWSFCLKWWFEPLSSQPLRAFFPLGLEISSKQFQTVNIFMVKQRRYVCIF